MVMMTAPAAPFSCAASHTNPVGFRARRPSANGSFLPHGQPPGYPSALGSKGPLDVQCWVSEKFVPWGGGSDSECGLGLCRHLLPVSSSSFTHHSFPQRPNEFHRNGAVERRLQASTNGNSTGDTERLACCVLLQGLYQWKAAVNR